MTDDLKMQFLNLMELISESVSLSEMILTSDGSNESKAKILAEIASTQEHLKQAHAFLTK